MSVELVQIKLFVNIEKEWVMLVGLVLLKLLVTVLVVNVD